MSYNFALTGVAGYVARRHLQAIRDTGNNLVCAVDPHDSVGLMDSFFRNARFFTEFERFDRHIEKLRRSNSPEKIHYVSICSPNYLHDAHCRFALRVGADAICEKPLVLNRWNIDALQELEREYEKRVYTILQLRVHPALIELKRKLEENPPKTKKEIILTYITSRGAWYLVSWKGQKDRSGGLATNIGIHFFDLLIWLFGDVQRKEVHVSNETKVAGFMELKNARVRWMLSIDYNDLPEEALKKGEPTFRSLTMDGEEIEFSKGFTDLHTVVYQETLAGRGFGLEDARASIDLVQDIRDAAPIGIKDESHPFLLKK